MIRALLNRCFRLGYPVIFFDRYFKLALNRIHILKEKAPTVEKKCFRYRFTYLGTRSLQTRNDLQTFIKGVLKCYCFQESRLPNNFCFKDPVLFTSGVVYKFQCGFYMQNWLETILKEVVHM